jgi:hypothetical protein
MLLTQCLAALLSLYQTATELCSQGGFAALLQVASANKLQQLVLGAVTLPNNGYVQLLEVLRCHDTQLQQLTVEAPCECVTLDRVMCYRLL